MARFADLIGNAGFRVGGAIVREIAKQLPLFSWRGLQKGGLQAPQLL